MGNCVDLQHMMGRSGELPRHVLPMHLRAIKHHVNDHDTRHVPTTSFDPPLLEVSIDTQSHSLLATRVSVIVASMSIRSELDSCKWTKSKQSASKELLHALNTRCPWGMICDQAALSPRFYCLNA